MSADGNGTADTPDDGGAEVEKWIFRVLLLGVLGLVAVAALSSIDDIRRYLRMRAM